eukprot:CAMPEP_0196737712 /NCGR_PEP_ID=MMETSP1091-20130531/15357_1 /TAXON_ID=302021 /ORGANISM="Rhodomonas sp., Strain CCMP768" /LENGTH=48 /DNA_ID= /DNA_START= /DNA_END= /DNA_ORIENTATION=
MSSDDSSGFFGAVIPWWFCPRPDSFTSRVGWFCMKFWLKFAPGAPVPG